MSVSPHSRPLKMKSISSPFFPTIEPLPEATKQVLLALVIPELRSGHRIGESRRRADHIAVDPGAEREMPHSGVHGLVNGPEPSRPNSNNSRPLPPGAPPIPAIAEDAIRIANVAKATAGRKVTRLKRGIINALRSRRSFAEIRFGGLLDSISRPQLRSRHPARQMTGSKIGRAPREIAGMRFIRPAAAESRA